MASKRARKHRAQVRQEQAQRQAQRQTQPQAGTGRRYQPPRPRPTPRPADPIQQAYNKALADYRKQAKKANTRLARLEAAGLQNTIYTMTINALGSTRFRLPKNAEELEQFGAILRKFLGDETSTVGGAKKAAAKNKSDFATFLNRSTGGKISDDVANKLASQMGNLELKELLKVYVYNEIRDAFVDLENAGITPTSDNLKRTLDTTIDNVIVDEITKQGVAIPPQIKTEVIDIARTEGIQSAIAYIDEYKRGEQRINTDGGDGDDVYPF